MDNALPGYEMIVAAVLSLALEVVPGLTAQWEKLTARQKQIAIGFAALVLTIGGAVISCQRYNNCPTDWVAYASDLLVVFILTFGATQVTHMGTDYITSNKKSADDPEVK